MAKALCSIVVVTLLGVALSQDQLPGRSVSDTEAASLVGGSEDCTRAYSTQCTGGGCSGGCACGSGGSTTYYIGSTQDCPGVQRSGCSTVYNYWSACCVPCS